MNSEDAPLERAIQAVGGLIPLAKQLNVTPQAVSAWRARQVPVMRVLDIERLSGVPRHELRPDIYPPAEASS